MRASGLILTIAMLLAVSCAVGADGPEVGVWGGGPMPSVLFLDLGGLNAAVTAAGYPRISEVLFTMGGASYGGRLSDGVRFGGTGSSGATISRDGERSARFGLETYGLMVEKIAASDAGLTIALGTVLGGGSLDLRLIDRYPDSLEDAVGAPYVASMTKCFYALQPYVAFEARPFRWMTARFQLGFLWALTDRWAFEEVEFSGPPRTLTGLAASLTMRFGWHEGDDEDTPTEEDVEE